MDSNTPTDVRFTVETDFLSLPRVASINHNSTNPIRILTQVFFRYKRRTGSSVLFRFRLPRYCFGANVGPPSPRSTLGGKFGTPFFTAPYINLQRSYRKQLCTTPCRSLDGALQEHSVLPRKNILREVTTSIFLPKRGLPAAAFGLTGAGATEGVGVGAAVSKGKIE